MTHRNDAGRRDIRTSHLVFSIDPLGCEDVDDALCARALDNGNVELSVHIADVSYFVKPGSLNDRVSTHEMYNHMPFPGVSRLF